MKIILTAIVRDEEDNIVSMLDSVKDSIDALCITDTGSTDKTLRLIEDWASKHSIPYSLHVMKWVNDFSTARNISFENSIRVSRTIDISGIWYIFNMDADDTMTGYIDRSLLKYDSYQISKTRGSIEYTFPHLFRIYDEGEQWNWKFPIHEVPSIKKPYQSLVLYNVNIISNSKGYRSKQSCTYIDDAASCAKWLRNNPRANDEDKGRMLFYAAQSWAIVDDDIAYIYYERKHKMNDSVGETYIAGIRCAEHIWDKYEEKFECFDILLKVMTMYPERLEAKHCFLAIANKAGYDKLASSLCVLDRSRLNHDNLFLLMSRLTSDMHLFLDSSVYKWKYLYEVFIMYSKTKNDICYELYAEIMKCDSVDKCSIKFLDDEINKLTYSLS